MTARNFAAGAEKLGLCPEVQAEGKTWRFIGIQAKNRKEWNIMHLANMYNKTTTIALYDTLGAEAARFVIDETEMTTIACSKDLVNKIVDMKQEDDKMPEAERMLHRLKNIVCFESDCDTAQLESAEKCGLKVFSFDDVTAAGISHMAEYKPVEPQPDDCCVFSYTSGTTGNPKGVKLTQKGLLMSATSVMIRMKKYNVGLGD